MQIFVKKEKTLIIKLLCLRFLTLYVLGLGVFLKRITDWYYTFFSIFWKRSLCFSLFIPLYHISLHITELACWYYFFTTSVMFFWNWLNFLLLSRHEVEINKYCIVSDILAGINFCIFDDGGLWPDNYLHLTDKNKR